MKPPLGKATMVVVLGRQGTAKETQRQKSLSYNHTFFSLLESCISGVWTCWGRLTFNQEGAGERPCMTTFHSLTTGLPKYHEATSTPGIFTLFLHWIAHLLGGGSGLVGFGGGRRLQLPLEAKSGAQQARGCVPSRVQKTAPSHPQMHSPQWREIPGRLGLTSSPLSDLAPNSWLHRSDLRGCFPLSASSVQSLDRWRPVSSVLSRRAPRKDIILGRHARSELPLPLVSILPPGRSSPVCDWSQTWQSSSRG